MRYLFDTHVMLWFLEDADELSKKARKILKNGEYELFWSAASYWELTVKLSLGKLKLQKGWQAFLAQEKRPIEFWVFLSMNGIVSHTSPFHGFIEIPSIVY